MSGSFNGPIFKKIYTRFLEYVWNFSGDFSLMMDKSALVNIELITRRMNQYC